MRTAHKRRSPTKDGMKGEKTKPIPRGTVAWNAAGRSSDVVLRPPPLAPQAPILHEVDIRWSGMRKHRRPQTMSPRSGVESEALDEEVSRW